MSRWIVGGFYLFIRLSRWIVGGWSSHRCVLLQPSFRILKILCLSSIFCFFNFTLIMSGNRTFTVYIKSEKPDLISGFQTYSIVQSAREHRRRANVHTIKITMKPYSKKTSEIGPLERKF